MLIEELTLRGLLSFAPDAEPLMLQPLNVFIGPNGSGKSNLVEGISLLRSAATKLTAPLRGAGGVTEWLWKGTKNGSAVIDAVISYPAGRQSLRHSIVFTEKGSRFELIDEAIENRDPQPGYPDRFFYYRYQHGRPVIAVQGVDNKRPLRREDVAPDQSILTQRKDPDLYPELAYLSDTYAKVRLFREWSFGRSSVFRSPQRAEARVCRRRPHGRRR
jgi:predicted ATPase